MPATRSPTIADRALAVTVLIPAATLIVGMVVGVAWLRLVEPLHTAVAVVGPAAAAVVPSSLDGWGRGGVRTAARDDDPAAAVPPFLRAVELLSGALLADDLARDPLLLDAVLGVGGDVSGPGDMARRLLAAAVGRSAADRPDVDRLRAHLRTRFRVETTAQAGLRRITYRHADPQVARLVIAAAVRAADERLRTVATDRSTALVAHLRRQLADGTGPTERRLGLAALLEDEERRLLLLAAAVPHAIETVAGPTATARPDDPDPTVSLAVAAVGGLSIGLLAVRLVRRADA